MHPSECVLALWVAGPPMVFNRNFFAISQLSEVMPTGR